MNVKDLQEEYIASTMISRMEAYEEQLHWWKLLFPGEDPHFFNDPRIMYKNIIKKYNIDLKDFE